MISSYYYIVVLSCSLLLHDCIIFLIKFLNQVIYMIIMLYCHIMIYHVVISL